jgi:predicted dehydrogenase
MKFLVIGLGSMGKRRIRNLQYLKAGEIIGFDPQEDRRKEAEEKYKIRTFRDFEKAMAENPDALVISTPPDLHMKYAIIAARRNKHFFTEASVVDEGMEELISSIKDKKIVAAPSCTMRFHPAMKKIKELVDKGTIGKPLAFTHHCSQYLPDWHPWEDYRKFYVAKRATGAAREIMPFELVWLTWAFGDVDTISCFKGKLSKLDVDIDDTYQLILKLKSGVLGHILIDVIARAPLRVFRLLGEEGVIEWDWGTKILRVFTAGDKKWREYPTEEGAPEERYIVGEKMYIEEMNQFLKAIKGEGRYPYSFEDDRKVLKILYAAEESSEKGKHISLAKSP